MEVDQAPRPAPNGGYWLLPLLLPLIPMLYRVQELSVRLGIYTGCGHGELIRERFGVGWAWLSTEGVAAAVIWLADH
jgi:Mn2+/Fe2+ NRAMP family transporter